MDASKMLGRKHILIGMGDTGAVTRIRSDMLNNEFTFGYAGEPTAPGQFPAEDMERFGNDLIVTGVTGHPLSHSLSPAMQNAAIRAAGIDGIYLRFDSGSTDRMEDAIRDYDIRGMNVTIPYKQNVIPHLDGLSDAAETIGAVNTVVNDGGVLTGYNTDTGGILYALRHTELKGKSVLIMGSGGAARAAAYTFMKEGCSVRVCGRNTKTVSELSCDLGTEIGNFTGGSDIIVNCTPVGLANGEYPADISNLTGDQIVFDMVYGRPTPLTDTAASKGCRTIDGREMLIGQGAASFRLWFGKEPDTDVMRRAVY